MTRFSVGQLVVSNTNAQGLVSGQVYEVAKVDRHPTFAGEFVTYWLSRGVGAKLLPVGNGHLLLAEAR